MHCGRSCATRHGCATVTFGYAARRAQARQTITANCREHHVATGSSDSDDGPSLRAKFKGFRHPVITYKPRVFRLDIKNALKQMEDLLIISDVAAWPCAANWKTPNDQQWPSDKRREKQRACGNDVIGMCAQDRLIIDDIRYLQCTAVQSPEVLLRNRPKKVQRLHQPRRNAGPAAEQ